MAQPAETPIAPAQDDDRHVNLALVRSGVPGIMWPGLPRGSGPVVLATAYQLESSQWWDAERRAVMQLRQLNALLHHAANHVPYLKDRLAPVRPQKDRPMTWEAFQSLPLLTRAEIQDAGDAYRAGAMPPDHGRIIPVSTSGSTGTPLETWRTEAEMLIATALNMRNHTWHKRDFTGSNVTIKAGAVNRPGARDWASCYLTGRAHRLDAREKPEILFEQILDADPDYLQSHPSLLKEILKISRADGRRPKRLREARTYGETVGPELRQMCREIWGVKTSDAYSTEECGPIACESPDTEGYLIHAENLVVEVLDDDGNPCKPGEVGRVAITQLHNFAAPLLRYVLGDWAEVAPPCPKGRGLPMLKRILGRERNLARLPSGGRRHPIFWEKDILAIAPFRQYQLVQTALETIEMHHVIGEPLTADQEQALARHFNDMLGDRFHYSFVRRDEIPPKPNGKFEIFRCEVPDED